MAEFLKRLYDLLDLKVTLDTSGREPVVVCELEATSTGVTRRVNCWTFPPAAFGLSESQDMGRSRAAATPFRLPDQFAEQLREQLAGVGVSGAPGVWGPLWLHLARPYGYLGLVPWAQLLREKGISMPILRLPEFVVRPPRETPSTLDVLLWASTPAAKPEFDLLGYLGTVVRQAPKEVPRRVTFHVFTDAQWYGELRQRWQAENLLGDSVILYDPADASGLPVPPREVPTTDPSGSVENPWFLWMHKALQGRSVDVVHFVGHGYFSRECPALAVAEGPLRNRDEEQARFIRPAQLNTFLTLVGAWVFACSSPEHNFSELGLRHLANTLAQLRPGAVLFHDLSRDPQGTELEQVYRFLFSPPPQSPGAWSSLFLYCQPYQVGQAETRASSRGTGSQGAPPVVPEPADAALELFTQAQNVPAWLAATQRYVEQWQWKLQYLLGGQSEPSGPGPRQEEIDGVRRALSQIQGLVAQVLREGKGGAQ
jgi:hypothetical protein